MRGRWWGRRGRPGRGLGRIIHELLARLPSWLQPEKIEEIYLPILGGIGDPVVIYMDELEAFRLVYLEGLTQEEAAARLGTSRGTLWRMLDSARRKLATALASRRPLVLASP